MIDTKEFTDMYLIATALSYGFRTVSTIRTDTNRQRYVFMNSVQTVYVKSLEGFVDKVDVDIEEMERYFSSRQLLFPSTYPDVLKTLKQDILSHKRVKE